MSLSAPPFARAQAVPHQGTLKGLKSVYGNAFTYEGAIVGGKAHGTGVATFYSYVYTGEWRHGKRHGRGRLCRKDGKAGKEDHEGEWRDGKKV